MIASSVRRTPTHTVTVHSVRELTPRMRRLTLNGPSLIGIEVAPAQDVELILDDGAGHRVKRRYTIRSTRPDVGEIDIDALVHPHGPGGRWIAEVTEGSEVQFLGPRGHLEIRPAGWHLLLGDEAGLPAIASLVQALPAGEAAIVLAEVDGSSDELPIERSDGEVAVRWLHRTGRPAGSPALFIRALAELVTPRGEGQAYLLGESRAMVALRPHVREHHVTDERMFVKGYWNLGRAGRQIPAL